MAEVIPFSEEEERAIVLINEALHDIKRYLDNLPLGSTQEFDTYLRNDLCLASIFEKDSALEGDSVRHLGRTKVHEFCRYIYTHLYYLASASYLEVFFAVHDLIFHHVTSSYAMYHVGTSERPRIVTMYHWFKDERADVIRLFLEGKATRIYVEGVTYINWSHIGIANAEIIDLLFAHGHRFNKYDVMYAAKQENIYAIRRLLEAGALANDTSLVTVYGTGTSYEAFTSSNIEIMRLFMMHGGNPFERREDGATTLIGLAGKFVPKSEEDEECVKELLGYGVDPNIPDRLGRYPIDFMTMRGFSRACCDLVREAMKRRK